MSNRATRKAITDAEKDRYNLYNGTKVIHYKDRTKGDNGDVVRKLNSTDAAKKFSELLKQVINFHQAIVTLYGALVGEGPNTQIAFPVKDGNFAVLTRADLRDAERLFKEEVKNLKMYFLYSRKGRNNPEPDSFKSGYAPVFLGDALLEFFLGNVSGFGTVDPDDPNSGLIIDQLKAIGEGYAMRVIIVQLFYTYLNNSELQRADNRSYWTADKHINDVFGKMPATFTLQGSSKKLQTGGKRDTTFDVLEANRRFKRNNLKGHDINSICSLNYLTRKNLSEYGDSTFKLDGKDMPYSEAAKNFDSDFYRKGMLADHAIVVQNRGYWAKKNKANKK